MSHRQGGKPYARGSSSGGFPDGQWLHDKAPGAERARASRPAETRNPDQSSSKLLVDNLHYEVSEKDLANLFGRYGTLTKEPSIRYDRSGRSTGSATILFDEQADAASALKGLNGQLAKGQEMQVRFDSRSSGGRGAGGAGTLLSRLEKVPLANRLSEKNSEKNDSSEQSAANKEHSGGVGPHRTRGGRSRGGGRGGSGGGGRTRERPPAKKNVTAEDLDKELDQYGSQAVDGPVAVQAGAVDPVVPPPAPPIADGDGDVEMA